MMNSNETLDDIQWQTLIQQTAGFFSDLTIKRGFQYYKQGRVHASEPADETGVVEASVDGTETYRTKLHLRSLSDSECDCPVKDGRKHMVAVLLDYAQLQGRSIHALVNAHSTTYASTSSYDRSESGFSPAQDRPSAGASKWRVKADHLPDLPISAWHELFEVCTASLGTNTQNSFYAKMRWLPSITLNPASARSGSVIRAPCASLHSREARQATRQCLEFLRLLHRLSYTGGDGSYPGQN